MGKVAEARFERSKVDKFEARRGELADATLATLGELGYASTSLREIANNTEFSHGVLHYYFRDKVELITYCVRRYKESCVTRYDAIIDESPDAATLRDNFSAALVGTMIDDFDMHRLWYDLRTQSMFHPELRPTVIDLDGQLERMIWRVIEAYAARLDVPLDVSSAMAYSTMDGLFENALHRHGAGDQSSAGRLRVEAADLLTRLVRA